MRRPPFCPNRDCEFHRLDHPRLQQRSPHHCWYARCGYYRSKVRGRVQRFRCRRCGTTCSEQTFRLDYYLKRRISFRRIEQCITNCCGVRATGRVLGCSADSVSNRVSRLARQYVAAHGRLQRRLTLQEPVAADGFQSFAVSQYYPNNIHLLAGCRSQFVHFIDYATIRRSGMMTDRQRRLRDALEQLYRAPRDGISRSFGNLVSELARLQRRSAEAVDVLWTDLRAEYTQELHRNPEIRERMRTRRFEHRTVSSRRHRDVHNPLFAVNYLDRELRKGLAEHVRETTRFARNVNNSMERLWVYVGVHNLRKRFRTNNPPKDSRVHAELAGLNRANINEVLCRIYTRRRFYSHEPIGGSGETIWNRGYQTPLRGLNRDLLRSVRRLGAVRKISVPEIRQQLGISKPSIPMPEYVPAYVLG